MDAHRVSESRFRPREIVSAKILISEVPKKISSSTYADVVWNVIDELHVLQRHVDLVFRLQLRLVVFQLVRHPHVLLVQRQAGELNVARFAVVVVGM